MNWLREIILYILNRLVLPPVQFFGLLVVLAVLFLTGGSSRGDVQSLAILNPAMVLFSGLAFLTLKKIDLRRKQIFLMSFICSFFLVFFYVAVVPKMFEGMSQAASDLVSLPGAANISSKSHYFTITPVAGWQSLFFLFAPLAVFIFAVQLKRDDLERMLCVIILAGTISGIVGVLQLVGSPDGPLYFYRITNNGSAVGLFANRNHAAVFLACLFPMLALVAARSNTSGQSRRDLQRLIAIAIGIVLIPLILVTGSRSGMLAAAVGLIGGMLVYNSHVFARRGSQKRKYFVIIALMTALVSLVFATIYFSRAEAIERIFAEPTNASDRAEYWASSLKLFWQYFPFGFGPGSFVSVFQKEEPMALLSGTYLNRLHNDWLETVLTYGVPGIVLLICATVYYARRTYLLWARMDGTRTAVATGRMASIIIAILAIASMSDYPLRTPAIMGFLILVVIWFNEADRNTSEIAHKSGDSAARFSHDV